MTKAVVLNITNSAMYLNIFKIIFTNEYTRKNYSAVFQCKIVLLRLPVIWQSASLHSISYSYRVSSLLIMFFQKSENKFLCFVI